MKFGSMTLYRSTLCAVFVLFLLTIASRTALANRRGDLLASGLRCEGRAAPLGIESLHPKLSWHLDARSVALRGLRQTAYRVLAETPTCGTARK